MKPGGVNSRDRSGWGNRERFGDLLLLYILIGILAACKKEHAVYTVRMTVLSAVPDADSFDIYAGGGKLKTFAPFGSPDYNISVPALTDTIGWKLRGTRDFDSVFIADLPNGQDFTLLFYDSAGRYKPFLVWDDWKKEDSKNKGYVRFLPMTINANALSIKNDTGKVLISGRSFGDFASNGAPFSPIDTTVNTLKLYNNNELLDSLPNTTILPGRSYSLYTVGVLGATGNKKPRMILHRHE